MAFKRIEKHRFEWSGNVVDDMARQITREMRPTLEVVTADGVVTDWSVTDAPFPRGEGVAELGRLVAFWRAVLTVVREVEEACA